MSNVASGRGWLEMTDVSSQLADSIVRLDPNGLYVMTACGTDRKADSNDSELDDALASSQFEKMVAELAGYFDFIVIDAPTICGSIGAQQLAQIADGTIVVARAGRTHHSRITTAVELVPQERRLGNSAERIRSRRNARASERWERFVYQATVRAQELKWKNKHRTENIAPSPELRLFE